MDKINIKLRLYNLIYRFLSTLKHILYFIKSFLTTRRFKSIALMLIGILCIVASLIFIYIGIKEGEFNSSYKEVFIVESGFVGIILAIFFTLVTIPIQNVISRYSTAFFKRVSRNRTYRVSFIILALILLYNIGVIILGGNQFFAYATGVLGLLTMIILGVLILETFHLLDLRNVISLIAKDSIKELKKNIKSSEFWRKFRNKIKGIIYGKAFLELMRTPFEVEEWVIERLKNSLDPIVSATNKAILEDNYEIAQSGYSNFVKVICNYLECRKNFGTDDDNFLYYVNDNLIDQLKISAKYSEHRYIFLIGESAFKIAEACLVAKPIRSNFGENNLVNPFMTMLKRIALSPEIFKETSYAPSRAINRLGTLGKKLVEEGFSTTSYYVAEYLGEISINLVKTNIHFHGILCQQANTGLMGIITAGFESMEKIKTDYFFKIIREQILQFFVEYLSLKRSYAMKSKVTFPFYDTLSQSYSFSRLFFTALNRIYPDNLDWNLIEREVKEVVKLIKTIGDISIENKQYIDLRDLIEQIYRIFIIDLIFILRKNVGERKKRFCSENMTWIVEIVLEFLSKILGKKGNEIALSDILDVTFSMLGIVFYYKYKEGKNEFEELIEKITRTALDILTKISQEIISGDDGQMFCRYLRLSGSWYMHFERSSDWVKTLAKNIAEKQKVVSYPNFKSHEEIYYPTSKIGREWSLQRVHDMLTATGWNELNDFLQDEGSKKQFDDLVESFREEKL